MLKKVIYGFKCRGVWGMIKLLVSYGVWYFYKALSSNRIFIKRVNNTKMALNLDDPGLSTTIGRGGAREKAHTQVLLHELKEGMTVLDIGANLGYYALMEADQVGPQGMIYAVEPVPSNFQFLKKNIQINEFEGRIQAFQMAISAQKGTQKLFLSRLSNLNTLYQSGGEAKQAMTGKTIDVETMDLVSFLEDKRAIDLIRMDIEGAEVEVLRGLVRYLDAGGKPPKVLFETHRPKYGTGERSIEQPLRELFDRGYCVKTLVSNCDDGKKWLDRGYEPERLIMTDGTTRGIYKKVRQQDALDLIVRRGGVRAVLLVCG